MASSQSPGAASPALRAQMQERRRVNLQQYSVSPGKMRLSVPLPARFEDGTDEEDEEEQGEAADKAVFQKSILGVFSQAGTKAKLEEATESDSDVEQEDYKQQQGHDAVQDVGAVPSRKFSDNKILRPLLKPRRKRAESESQDAMSQSQFLPPRETAQDVPERPASAGGERARDDTPLIERKLQAQADAEMETSTGSIRRKSKDESQPVEKGARLMKAVADIFDLPEPEEVLAVWSCWYLEKALLQGHLYVTSKHLCYYAYLRRRGVVLKSGYMAKQGKRDPRYSRFWFQLKGDVLSYYKDASHLYFPHGSIDLRFAITATLAPEKGKTNKDTPYFTVTTETRTYYFKADSSTNAKEWVKQLQRVIFRSHNDGDSVKISLPIRNIINVEAAPFVDGADTVKVSTVDGADAFAIEEYFFTFHDHGEDALRLLSVLTEDNEVKQAVEDGVQDVAEPASRQSGSGKRSTPANQSRSPRLSTSPALFVEENVRKTLSPLSVPASRSPRSSGEFGRASLETSRPSIDRPVSGNDRGRDARPRADTGDFSQVPTSPSTHQSTDSFATTIEHPMSSPSVGPADSDMSASQMLTGDNAFRAPTLRMPAPRRTESESSAERIREELDEASRSNSAGSGRIRVQPPTRTHTDQTLGDGESSHSRKSNDTVARREKSDGSKPHESTSTIAPRPSRPIATPLLSATKMASYVRDQSKRVVNTLSSSPGIYYEKVSGALAGGRRSYVTSEGLPPEDALQEEEIEEKTRSFRKHFSLPESEQLVSSHGCALYRVLPLLGKIYLGTSYFCYRSLIAGISSKMVIPLRDILNVGKMNGYRLGAYAMVLVIKGHEELFFEFSKADDRDFCVVDVLRALQAVGDVDDAAFLTEQEAMDAEVAAAENELLQQARNEGDLASRAELKDVSDDGPPILFDDGNASMLDFKPKEPMRVTCLTIGSRGDVQPYIALCKGLIADGHHPKIATHAEFEPWIRKHGIDFAPVGGNPAELMALCVEYGMFTPKFISETNSKFRGWLDDLLVSAWEACQGSEVLIESPSAMAGIHIAEALGIPYFRAFTMPWTKTRAYPHAFAPLASKFGGNYNIGTYTVFNNVFWQLTARQINSWRRRTLGIRNTSIGAMRQNEVPFLYNFSPNVVAPPLDFSAWVHITGYWFLDEAQDWTPPADLLAFIAKARADNMKLVYIGFGSVVVSDSKAMTQHIVDAVLKADVRCILSKGWSDRLDPTTPQTAPEIPLPPSIFQISSAPHDWLFAQLDAAVHHGGAGTTGASLRAGIPTIIRPFFGDQFFFASRVEDIGVGLRLRHLTPNALGKALWIATHDARVRDKAALLGARIRAENGVQTALSALYRDLEYARRLVKRKVGKRLRAPGEKGVEWEDNEEGEGAGFGFDGEDGGEEEEEWTFVDEEEERNGGGDGATGVGIGDPMGWEARAAQRRFLGAFGGRVARVGSRGGDVR